MCCRQKTFNENETEKSLRTEWISINADEANYSYANYGVLIYKNERLFLIFFFFLTPPHRQNCLGNLQDFPAKGNLGYNFWKHWEIYQTKITFIFWCLDCWMDKLARFKKSSWPLGDCKGHIWRDTTIWLMKGEKLKFLDANLNSNLELVIIFKGRWRKL